MKLCRKNWGRQFLAGIAAIGVTALILAVACTREEKEQVYDIVFLGDSIVGNVSGEISITDVIEERLGCSVYNGALGGTCLSLNNPELYESKSNVHWSMTEIAKSICGEDFRTLLGEARYAERYRSINMIPLEYFYERINGLGEIDFSKVGLLIIEHGTNDYNCGQEVDNPLDPMDERTFGGGLRSALTLLQEKYPELRILLVSPIYCEIPGDPVQKCYETDFGGGTLDEYVEKEREIAREYGVEWLDLYHSSGIWEENVQEYLYDGLHPNDEGIALLGNLIADYLME